MRKAVILGAAGRDFHNFNVYFRGNDEYQVVAFTATQIPFIENRIYPAELAGPRYPEGIPIFPEGELEELIKKFGVNDVFFSYSDVSFEQVMKLASESISCGASFHLLGLNDTMLNSKRPVVAVLGGRTGVGKSTISRLVYRELRDCGLKPVIIRHPMPYESLKKGVERYATVNDLVASKLSIEEVEEYEPHVENGATVYAGVDYAKILGMAEDEGNVIIWDGGNNDLPFVRPDLTLTVVDATRMNSVSGYYPGEACVRMADVVVINKVNLVGQDSVDKIEGEIRGLNRRAKISKTESRVFVEKPEQIRGKRCLAVEDGPTVTHGGLSVGAAYNAIISLNGVPVDPRGYAVGTIKGTYTKYPHIGNVLPALGYSGEQLKELETTINAVPADTVVLGTTANLGLFIKINRPTVRAKYEATEIGGTLHNEIEKFCSMKS
ncbi:MAG: GTPase [Nitrososphaerota archaeon]|nr:GTPase [Nitrososphaerota archaeon]MDG6944024.1 GTPase [Nitrososphaerota archaeon]